MRFGKVSVGALGFLFAATALAPGAHPPAKTPPVFPLSNGTAWTYQGIVKWADARTGRAHEKDVTWKMEVVETFERREVMAAHVKGFPSDLMWYSEDRPPGDYLIVGVSGYKFYLLQEPLVQPALKKLRDPNDSLQGLVQEPQLFLDFPLIVGKEFGETEMLTRTSDGLYRWWVEEEKENDLGKIQGLSLAGKVHVYTISYRALTDHTFLDFVSSVGITRYVSGHHGTLSEVDVKLVEYHAGNP